MLGRQDFKGSSFTKSAFQVAACLVETSRQRGSNRFVFHNAAGLQAQFLAGVCGLLEGGVGVRDEFVVLVALAFESFRVGVPLAPETVNSYRHAPE